MITKNTAQEEHSKKAKTEAETGRNQEATTAANCTSSNRHHRKLAEAENR
jgi:hypothetical protein